MGLRLKIPGWLLLIALACAGPQPGAAADLDRSMRWFDKAPDRNLIGVALVVHGLNLNPDRMTNLIRILNTMGIGALQVSLKGHGDNFEPLPGMALADARMEAFKSVSHQIWADDFLKAYRYIMQLRPDPDVPLFLIADSFGALLALDLSLNEPDVEFGRMVLFAPAVSMRGRNSLIRLLSPFPRFVVPSLSPGFYKANRGTPQTAYAVVFETLARFERSIGPKINIPTLVFIDPKDELVSYEGLRALLKQHELDRWRVFRVEKDMTTAATRIHHLIIDPASVGQSTWRGMMERMHRHLKVDESLKLPYN